MKTTYLFAGETKQSSPLLIPSTGLKKMKLATDETMVLQESDVYHCTKSTFETNVFACMFTGESANTAKQIFACDT